MVTSNFQEVISIVNTENRMTKETNYNLITTFNTILRSLLVVTLCDKIPNYIIKYLQQTENVVEKSNGYESNYNEHLNRKEDISS
jgi:hypothetical protein